MPDIAYLRRNRVFLAWFAFSLANLAVMTAWPRWETIPFHLIWVSLTLLYGFRIWPPVPTAVLLAIVAVATGAAILHDALGGTQPWDEISEVPLMSAMFLAMVWHAQRRQEALRVAESESAERAATLARQERFLNDVSHELRTPVTIARGHLEVLLREARAPEAEVALDELERIERLVERLLLLARAEQPDAFAPREIELEPFLEDVFMRWSEVAPRAWRLGAVARGSIEVDEDALRHALDALLENAVKYTEPAESIELSATATNGHVLIRIADDGCGIPLEARGRIFERFGRADVARSRSDGGVGLGLAIVDAIARAHGGRCTLETNGGAGSTFALELPRFAAALHAARRSSSSPSHAAEPAGTASRLRAT